MKKLFLGIAALGMLAACNQTTKTSNTTQSTAATTTTAPGASPLTTKAPTAEETAAAPVIKFEKDTYDFGKIKQGDKVSYNFKFANTGKSPLIITGAVASCGCTTPEWPKAPVKPGDKGVIKVTFNSTGKMGLQDKLITITANTIPTSTLAHLTGEVEIPTAKK
jgi:ABC-type glycerol-3-phosphate transport system substrate-binding protein